MKKLLTIFAATLLLSGCVNVMTAEQAAPELNKPITEKLTIAVVDNRPYVLDGDKESNFEGITRSTFGIPFSRYTYNKEPMSVFLSNRLLAGFKKTGVNVSSIETTPTINLNDIKATDSKLVVVILNEWKYDYHAFYDNSWYDFNVFIKDVSGNTLINKNFVGEQDVPDLTVDDLQLLYKTRFEIAFSDPEIASLL
jgi:hypothetical protein